MPARPSRAKGFTLIELLAVIVIMSIIAGLVIYAAAGARKKAQIDAAKAGIARIAMRIDQYRAKRGALPEDPAGLTDEDFVFEKLNAWGFNVSPREQLDPWDSPFIIVFRTDYEKNDASGSNFFALTGKMAEMYDSVSTYKDVYSDDDPNKPYLDQQGSYQIISAGPDGFISRNNLDAVNVDNLSNW